MRKLQLIIGILVAISFGCKKNKANKNMPCIPSEFVGDVIAFYSFSGGSIEDFSGNDRHLNNSTAASPAADRAGNAQCAFQFDNLSASNQFLNFSNPTFLNGLDEISISLWYKPTDSTRDGGAFEVLVGRDSITSCPDRSGQWSLSLYDCRRAVFGSTNSVWDQSTSGSFDCAEIVNENTGVWHHVVATYDFENYNSRLFKDGVLQESGTGNEGCSSAIILEEIGDLFLGLNYTGILDDVIILDEVINESEVIALYEMAPCCE